MPRGFTESSRSRRGEIRLPSPHPPSCRCPRPEPRASLRRVIPVRIEAVAKRFGSVEALRGLTLEFGAGKLTAILGPSGCGKTTLLRAIAGFVAVDAGRILFARDAVTALPPQARGA